MSKKIRDNANFLLLLEKADFKQRKALLDSINPQQLLAVCELILNILKGVIPVSDYTKRRLKNYVKVLRTLVQKNTVSRQKKIQLLLKHHRVIPVLIKACRKFLTSLRDD